MQFPGWIEWLEDRFGQLDIPFLLKGLIALNILTFFMVGMNPGFVELLYLDPIAVRNGEVWRLLSFLVIPRYSPDGDFSLVFLLIFVLFMWMVSNGLEEALGSFKLTLYLLISVTFIGTSCLLTNTLGYHAFLYQSLIVFFALLYPDIEILLFFIIPLKMKWLGIFIGSISALVFILAPLSQKALILASYSGFLIFTVPHFFQTWKNKRETERRRNRFEDGGDS
ncbi:MAG: hypothetical protein AAFY98_11240 [Verrucomicrobiota bacterium]